MTYNKKKSIKRLPKRKSKNGNQKKPKTHNSKRSFKRKKNSKKKNKSHKNLKLKNQTGGSIADNFYIVKPTDFDRNWVKDSTDKYYFKKAYVQIDSKQNYIGNSNVNEYMNADNMVMEITKTVKNKTYRKLNESKPKTPPKPKVAPGATRVKAAVTKTKVATPGAAQPPAGATPVTPVTNPATEPDPAAAAQPPGADPAPAPPAPVTPAAKVAGAPGADPAPADPVQPAATEPDPKSAGQTLLRLMTYNIYNLSCSKTSSVNISNFILKYPEEIDILCTQENKTLKELIGKYNPMVDCGAGSSEEVQIYISKEKYDEYNPTSECISHSESLFNTVRYAAVTTLPKLSDLTIASLHLEGGRFADQEFFSNYDLLIKQKLGLLEKVIGRGVDIICGDFNSVYSSNEVRLEEFINSQITYFEAIKETQLTEEEKENIRRLNLDPFQLLKASGYKYASPENDLQLVTNGRGKTTVDCFWYKPESIIPKSCKIIDKQGGTNWKRRCEYSDHNPVFLECEIVKNQQPGAATVVPQPASTDPSAGAPPEPVTQPEPVTPAAAEQAEIIKIQESIEGFIQDNTPQDQQTNEFLEIVLKISLIDDIDLLKSIEEIINSTGKTDQVKNNEVIEILNKEFKKPLYQELDE